MADIHGNKLSRDKGAGSRDRKPEALAKSDRLFRSGMRLHPRDGMDSVTQSYFPTPPHSQACFAPHRSNQAAWEFSRQTLCGFVEHWTFHRKHIASSEPLMERRQGDVSTGQDKFTSGTWLPVHVMSSLQINFSTLLESQARRFAIKIPGWWPD